MSGVAASVDSDDEVSADSVGDTYGASSDSICEDSAGMLASKFYEGDLASGVASELYDAGRN